MSADLNSEEKYRGSAPPDNRPTGQTPRWRLLDSSDGVYTLLDEASGKITLSVDSEHKKRTGQLPRDNF